jgi:hypothetical protein
MSDFGKKLLAIGVVSLIFFGLFAGITYVKVNSYDVGEATINAAQALLAGLAIVLANMARSIFGVVLLAAATVLAGAGGASADEYDDLGCYVGSQTRAEFYAARDRAVLVNDNEAAETNLPKWEAWRATHPRPYKPGDKIVHRNSNVLGDRVLTVARVEISNEHGWTIRDEEFGYGFAPDDVAPAPSVADAETAKWKAAYDREQARKAKKAAKKTKGKTASVDGDSPFMLTAGPLFGRFFNRSRCANGQCTPAPRSTPQAKPAQRYECRNGVCRSVQAK